MAAPPDRGGVSSVGASLAAATLAMEAITLFLFTAATACFLSALQFAHSGSYPVLSCLILIYINSEICI